MRSTYKDATTPADAIARRITELSMTRAEVAAQYPCDSAYISELTTGAQDVPPEAALKLAAILEMDPQWFAALVLQSRFPTAWKHAHGTSAHTSFYPLLTDPVRIVATRLRDLMMTQTGLAKKAGVSAQTVRNWSQKKVPLARVGEIAAALELDETWFAETALRFNFPDEMDVACGLKVTRRPSVTISAHPAPRRQPERAGHGRV